MFRPRDRADARAGSDLPADAPVLLFAGRIQPLKAPDVLLRAVAVLLEREPEPALAAGRARSSAGRPGSGLEHPESLAQLASALGLDDVVRFVPPVAQGELAEWYAAADLVAVPSYNESFGLVAVEAQASGTPVVAAAVGGLTTVVATGAAACSSTSHEPTTGPTPCAAARRRPGPARAARAGRARAGARSSPGTRTAEQTLEVYDRAAVVHARGRCLTCPVC